MKHIEDYKLFEAEELFEAEQPYVKIKSKWLKDLVNEWESDCDEIVNSWWERDRDQWDDDEDDDDEGEDNYNEVRRDDVSYFVHEYMSDNLEIGLNNSLEYRNGVYFDAIVDTITESSPIDKTPSKETLNEVEENFNEDVNGVMYDITLGISEEDFNGAYDKDYVDLIVYNSLLDSDTGLSYNGNYKDLLVELYLNKKFMKEFILLRIKKQNYEDLLVMKYIDKKVYDNTDKKILRGTIIKQILKDKVYKNIPILKDINIKLYDKYKHLGRAGAYGMFK